MEQQLSIIDIFCGIGGMSKGFLDAGYEVRQAIDNDKEKVSIYESIFGRNTSKCQDICLLQPEELKDADIITGRISLSALSTPVKRRGAYSHPINEWMINLVREKRPKAIVLETAGDAAADCQRDEWGELIEAVNAEKNSNIEPGRALEELMFKFFSEVEGFQCQLHSNIHISQTKFQTAE